MRKLKLSETATKDTAFVRKKPKGWGTGVLTPAPVLFPLLNPKLPSMRMGPENIVNIYSVSSSLITDRVLVTVLSVGGSEEKSHR